MGIGSAQLSLGCCNWVSLSFRLSICAHILLLIGLHAIFIMEFAKDEIHQDYCRYVGLQLITM